MGCMHSLLDALAHPRMGQHAQVPVVLGRVCFLFVENAGKIETRSDGGDDGGNDGDLAVVMVPMMVVMMVAMMVAWRW